MVVFSLKLCLTHKLAVIQLHLTYAMVKVEVGESMILLFALLTKQIRMCGAIKRSEALSLIWCISLSMFIVMKLIPTQTRFCLLKEPNLFAGGQMALT